MLEKKCAGKCIKSETVKMKWQRELNTILGTPKNKYFLTIAFSLDMNPFKNLFENISKILKSYGFAQ